MSIKSPIGLKKKWFAGEDKNLDWVIHNEDEVPEDITGWAIEFKMSVEPGDTAVLTLTGSLTDPTNGVCRVVVASDDTDGLTPATYYYELSRTDTDANAVLADGDAVLQARNQ